MATDLNKGNITANRIVMNNMKITIVAFCTLLLTTVLPTPALGAPVPWVGVLSSGKPITIPAGRILVIKNMCIGAGNGGSAPIPLVLSGTAAGGIGSGSFSTTIQYTTSSIGGLESSSSSLRLGPGMSLSVVSGSPLIVSVIGIAMDVADFPASGVSN
jgi:hypothetical protein